MLVLVYGLVIVLLFYYFLAEVIVLSPSEVVHFPPSEESVVAEMSMGWKGWL